jgi:hypothetical protein
MCLAMPTTDLVGYKLFRLRKDGSLGPLFINKQLRLDVGGTYEAEEHRTKGYAFRPGWHLCKTPTAPHLSKNNRVWAKVMAYDATEYPRPESQGGAWLLAKRITILELA